MMFEPPVDRGDVARINPTVCVVDATGALRLALAAADTNQQGEERQVYTIRYTDLLDIEAIQETEAGATLSAIVLGAETIDEAFLEKVKSVRQHWRELPLLLSAQHITAQELTRCVRAGIDDCLSFDELPQFWLLVRNCLQRFRHQHSHYLQLEQLGAIFQNTSDLIVLLSQERRLIRYNSAFAQHYARYSPLALVAGQTVDELFDPFFPAELLLEVNQRLKLANQGIASTFDIIATAQVPVHYEVRIFPIGSVANNDILHVVNLRDCTARRKDEEVNRKWQDEILLALIEGQDQERKRIAAELHDGIGQMVHALSLNLHTLEAQLHNNKIAIPPVMVPIRQLVDDTIDELRSISHNLMPRVLLDFGLEHALRQLCDRLRFSYQKNARPTPDVRLEVLNLPSGISTAAQASLYRIVQEIVHNAVKHAVAESVVIQINVRDEFLVLMIEDDGTGFDPREVAHSRGIGLRNIEARVKLLGGQLDIESAPEGGTSFIIEVLLSSIIYDKSQTY